MGWFLPSHMDQGVIFGGLGLWHLANTLSSFVRRPKEFRYRTWFPVRLPGTLRYLELWFILLVIVVFIGKQLSRASGDLSVGRIQMEHMQRYQHVTFASLFLVYAVAGLLSESLGVLPLPEGALHATFALGFAAELLVFHLGHHPGDNLESFVHMLMQVILVLMVAFMLLEIRYPRSFLVSVASSMLLVFKGTWFFHIGLLINVDACIPYGCIRGPSDYPICEDPESKMRARSLQVLVFGWHAAGIVVATYVAYAVMVHAHVYPVGKTHYHRLQFVDAAGELSDMSDGDLSPDSNAVPTISVVPRSLSRRLSRNSPRNKLDSPVVEPVILT